MKDLRECLSRVLDRAEKNVAQGNWSQQDDFDINDCVKQIKRKLLETQWANQAQLIGESEV